MLQTDWWLNETFSIGKVVKSISAPSPWLQRRRVSVTGPGPHPEARAAVREVSTGYGRCYSIYFEAEMAPRHDYYEIILDMSERKSGMLVRQFSAYEKSFAKKKQFRPFCLGILRSTSTRSGTRSVSTGASGRCSRCRSTWAGASSTC